MEVKFVQGTYSNTAEILTLEVGVEALNHYILSI